MIDDIKALRREYKEERLGHREKKYRILAKALKIAIGLRSDVLSTKAFFKLAGKKLPGEMVDEPKNLTAAVITYVTRAKSESAIKQAWKQARALDYLADNKGVEPKHIAKEIQERGGIEAIAKAAASEKPRRKKQAVVAKAVSKPAAKKQIAKSSPQIRSEPADDDDWDDLPLADETGSEGEMTTIVLHVSTAQKAEMEQILRSRRVKLICIRPPDGSSTAVAAVVDSIHRLKK
jgi:hypothetical protein